MHDAELSQWQAEQAAKKPADLRVDNFFELLFNGLGTHQGDELFKQRLAVCEQRVGTRTTNIVHQPGSGGESRPFACRPGGGVFQGGSALCPGF